MPTGLATPTPDAIRPDDPGGFLAAFAAHRLAGNKETALAAASEACHRSPHLATPHYAYGEAWLALGEPARAEQAFAAALGIAPGWADAWINYGLTRYRQGAIEDAKTAMRCFTRRTTRPPPPIWGLSCASPGDRTPRKRCCAALSTPATVGGHGLDLRLFFEGR